MKAIKAGKRESKTIKTTPETIGKEGKITKKGTRETPKGAWEDGGAGEDCKWDRSEEDDSQLFGLDCR